MPGHRVMRVSASRFLRLLTALPLPPPAAALMHVTCGLASAFPSPTAHGQLVRSGRLLVSAGAPFPGKRWPAGRRQQQCDGGAGLSQPAAGAEAVTGSIAVLCSGSKQHGQTPRLQR
ncbi:hypothetical protein GUJ93_ZPchr0004g40209 [Zizania palustris]|uniref:Secreted protein n=1 Tax=Zizania palustris TaxID=103762 RepID=A0A8J5SL44_ZIZPA|nr:hypothetical protein GUJ93_ZPchr0004g40209 [Zizania palustris]